MEKAVIGKSQPTRNEIIVTENEYHHYDYAPITYTLESNGEVYGRANITWKHLWMIFKHKLTGKVQVLVTPYAEDNKFRVEIIFKKTVSVRQKIHDWLLGIDRKSLDDYTIKEHNFYRKNYEETYD